MPDRKKFTIRTYVEPVPWSYLLDTSSIEDDGRIGEEDKARRGECSFLALTRLSGSAVGF